MLNNFSGRTSPYLNFCVCLIIALDFTMILLFFCVYVFQMVAEKLQEVLILEDDVDFEPNFRDNLEQVLEETHRLAPQWDLM